MCPSTVSSDPLRKPCWTEQIKALYHHRLTHSLTLGFYPTSENIDRADPDRSGCMGLCSWRIARTLFCYPYFPKHMGVAHGHHWYRKTLSELPRASQS